MEVLTALLSFQQQPTHQLLPTPAGSRPAVLNPSQQRNQSCFDSRSLFSSHADNLVVQLLEVTIGKKQSCACFSNQAAGTGCWPVNHMHQVWLPYVCLLPVLSAMAIIDSSIKAFAPVSDAVGVLHSITSISSGMPTHAVEAHTLPKPSRLRSHRRQALCAYQVRIQASLFSP
jgi:hypothetical protein